MPRIPAVVSKQCLVPHLSSTKQTLLWQHHQILAFHQGQASIQRGMLRVRLGPPQGMDRHRTLQSSRVCSSSIRPWATLQNKLSTSCSPTLLRVIHLKSYPLMTLAPRC
nr:hypothetical protein BaRGS_024687 [Batillaria attramentaria]